MPPNYTTMTLYSVYTERFITFSMYTVEPANAEILEVTYNKKNLYMVSAAFCHLTDISTS